MTDRTDETAAERAWFSKLEALLDAPPIGEDEAGDVLDLARVVAHTTERRFAPLTAYAAGLALAAEPTEGRRDRLRELVRALQAEATGRDGGTA